MSMADTDVFRVLTTQIRDLERRCVAVAPAKAAIFAFAGTDTSAASRGLVQADATIRSSLDAIGRVHSGKVTHVPMVLDSIGVLYEWYLTQEAAEGYPKLSLKKYKPIAARKEDAKVSRGLL
jgi:hypothetical protein